jgi:hypothetical protein
MDPYVSTIIRQALAIGASAGLLVAGIYFLAQYSKLQHAMTLNMFPEQLP